MNFHFYGLLIGIGIITSIQISAWLAKRHNYSSKIIWNGFWWVIVPAIIGARLYHVFDLWNDYYRFDTLNVLYIWNGGLAIFGALIGGFIGLYLYWLSNKQKFVICNLSFVILLNLIYFSLPLGQAIGRLGNYFNKELYGLPSSLSWAIRIGDQTFHPLFAYESLWLILGFLIMLNWELRGKFPNYFAFYLVWYGLGRFFLEFLRPPQFSWYLSIYSMSLNVAQIISVLSVIIGVKLLIKPKTNE